MDLSISKILIIGIFFVTYYLIIFGKTNKSVVAFSMGLLAALVKVSKNIKVSKIGDFIDFNTLGILLGMMIVVGILKTTGVFQAIAGYIVKKSKGNVISIFILTLIAVAVLSSMLDNVTTLLLFSPVILLICQEAEIKPEYFLFPMIFAANIGGTATMIGDPPNILVASASNKGFIEFLSVMILPTLLIFSLTLLFFLFKYKELKNATPEKFEKLLQIEPSKAITDKKLLYKGLLIFSMVIFGFIIHEYLDYEASLIALTGGAVMLLVSKKNFEEIAGDVEWNTLFFFVGLFTIVKALEDTNVITDITRIISSFSNHPLITLILVLWISGILAAFIGAVPVVTIFIPIIQKLILINPYGNELWWALALGASLGGNGTISGAASNMVIVGIIETNFKRKIKFFDFMKIGIIISLIGLIVSTFYLILRVKILKFL
ncbi:arsenical pump family protein [Tepiditoga spiralis]|uniref:Arsenical pump family protein n=1 Tax=Tepiditoga spiralis TaxID=2108365 RepID=A0A7G1GA38_9BACT|nr:ArsB/NhaD family transporter [Tepiditoga spiralis]BBE31923.1 arsenical pump family protein [Tepiditoga spiralis]